MNAAKNRGAEDYTQTGTKKPPEGGWMSGWV